jgi:aspartate aminotransferase, mitochondrial
MGGSSQMIQESLKLAYGEDSDLIKDKRIAAVQALSGTGACRLFADFQKRFLPNSQIYIPVPTWAKYAHNLLSFSISGTDGACVVKFRVKIKMMPLIL